MSGRTLPGSPNDPILVWVLMKLRDPEKWIISEWGKGTQSWAGTRKTRERWNVQQTGGPHGQMEENGGRKGKQRGRDKNQNGYLM